MTSSQKHLVPENQFDLSGPFADGRVRRALVHPAARSALVRRLQEQGFSPDSGFGGYTGRSVLAHALTAAEDELEMLDRQTVAVTAARVVLRAARRQCEESLR